MSEDEKTPNLSSQHVTKFENTLKSKEYTISNQSIKTLKENLWRSKQRLAQFVKKIGHLKNTPIREDVLQYCDNINKIKINADRLISYQRLQKLIHSRIQKMIKNKKIKQNWSQDDILILLWIISKNFDYYDVKNIQTELDPSFWEAISQMIPGIQDRDVCRFKWLSLRKNKLTQNYWLDIQSIQLDRIVRQTQSQDWQQISQKLYDRLTIPNKIYRCPKQCRQHWNCYLNPNLKKGPWSKEQDLLLLTCVENNNGMRRWTEIVNNFQGRTENALKNRFQLLLKKQKQKNKQINQLSQLQKVKYLKRKLYSEQFPQESLNEPEDIKHVYSKNTKREKEDMMKRIKRNIKKLNKQQNQQFQLYKPPRKRKQIKKQNKFLRINHLVSNNTNTDIQKTEDQQKKPIQNGENNKKVKQQQNQMKQQQAQEQIEVQNSSAMQEQFQQFKINKEKQQTLNQIKVDINQSGSALQFSLLSPFKPYCIGQSQRNISKQLLFSEIQIDEQQQVSVSKEYINKEVFKGRQKQQEIQNKKQSCTFFNQFYIRQMNHDLLNQIMSSLNKVFPKKDENHQSQDQKCYNNKNQNITSTIGEDKNNTVIRDHKTTFLPCILDKNKQKLIPFYFGEKKQSKQ